MKILHGGLGILMTVAVILVLLITSFEIGIYSDLKWYEKEYEIYHVAEDLEMEMKDVMYVTKEILAYLKGDREDLVVYTVVRGENQAFFNEREKAHMIDVRALFLGGLKIRLWGGIVILLSFITLVFMRKGWQQMLPKVFLIGTGIFAGIFAFLGILVALDFHRYFFLFHQIFFNNDLWILNPDTDLMIRMFPEGFFFDMVIRIGVIFTVGLVILMAISCVLCFKQRIKK